MRNKKSFTLLELLVTVIIIAVLGSVMLPFLAGAKQKADAAKFIGVISRVTVACEDFYSDTGLYAQSSSTRLTVEGMGWAQLYRSEDESGNPIDGWLGPYLKSPLTSKETPYNNIVRLYITGTIGTQAIWATATDGDGFDLDASGTVDTDQGNHLVFWGVPEAVAQRVNDKIDGDEGANWQGQGRIEFFTDAAGVNYLTVFIMRAVE